MFEARLLQGSILKKIIESIKDLVTDAFLDCTNTGISLKSLDCSHVCLIELFLGAEGFQYYKCDKNTSLGINLSAMAKILKCSGNDDIITLKAEDGADQISFIFESSIQNRVSKFSLKLIDIDSEHLGIPDMEHKCFVKMPSTEFQRIVHELVIIGDTVKISASKDEIQFNVSGDMGNGCIEYKQCQNINDNSKHIQVKSTEEEMSLIFALRYLNFFAKATILSDIVTLQISPDVPIVVQYAIEDLGYIRFFLASKIKDEQEMTI